jgi:hypothetical protein
MVWGTRTHSVKSELSVGPAAWIYDSIGLSFNAGPFGTAGGFDCVLAFSSKPAHGVRSKMGEDEFVSASARGSWPSGAAEDPR